MNVLNVICYGSAVVFMTMVFVFALATLVASVYSCFTKKVEGKLWTKIVISLGIGCTIPWILKIIVFFISKVGM